MNWIVGVCGCVGEWVGGWVSEWMAVYTGSGVDGWMDRQKSELVGGWVGECVWWVSRWLGG